MTTAIGTESKKISQPTPSYNCWMSPADAADPTKFITYKLCPSRHTTQNFFFIQKEIARESVIVFTVKKLRAIAASENSGSSDSLPLNSLLARSRENCIASTDRAQQLTLKKNR